MINKIFNQKFGKIKGVGFTPLAVQTNIWIFKKLSPFLTIINGAKPVINFFPDSREDLTGPKLLKKYWTFRNFPE